MKKLSSICAIMAVVAIAIPAHAAPDSDDQAYTDWRLESYVEWDDWHSNTQHVAEEMKTLNETMYGKPESSPGAGDAVIGLQAVVAAFFEQA